jgi:hypothetical protein
VKISFIISVLFVLAYAPLYWCASQELRRYIDQRFVISFFVPFIVGNLVPLLFFTSVIVTFIATVRDRRDIACRLVLLSLLLPNVSSDVFIGGAYIVNLATTKVLSVAAIIAAMVHRSGPERPPTKITSADLLVVVLLLINWWGGIRFPSLAAFVRGGATESLTLLVYVALRMNLRNREDLRHVVAAMVAACVILSVFALYEMRNHWALFDAINRQLSTRGYVTKNILIRGGFLRPSATMNGPLMLACVLSLAAIAGMVSRNFFRSSLTWAGCIAIILLGCLSCQSRGNAVGVAVGIMLVLALRGKWGQAGLVAGAGAGVAAAVLTFGFSSSAASAMFNLNASFTHEGVVYTDYRQLLLRRGLEEGLHHLWFGASMQDNLDRLSDIMQGQHIVDLVNCYLTMFLLSGLSGLVPALTLMLIGLASLFRKSARGAEDKALRAFVIAGTINMYLQLAFMSFIDRMPLVFGLVLAGGRLYLLTRETQPSAAQQGPVRRLRLVESMTPDDDLVLADTIPAPARQVAAAR